MTKNWNKMSKFVVQSEAPLYLRRHGPIIVIIIIKPSVVIIITAQKWQNIENAEMNIS